MGGELDDAVAGDVDPAKSVEHGLEDAAGAGGEIGVVAGGGFGDHAEGGSEVGGIALFEIGERFFGISQPFIEDGEDGVCHGGAFADAGLIVFEVLSDGGGGGYFFERVGEEI